MLNEKNKKNYELLNSECIDDIIVSVNKYLKQFKIGTKEKMAFTYSLDDCLVKIRENIGEDHPVECKFYAISGQPRVKISIEGSQYNPFAKTDASEDNEFDMISSNLNSYLDKSPVWKYINFKNVITFSLDKSKAETFPIRIVSAVIIGVILGLIFKLPLFSFMEVFVSDYLKPLSNLYGGLNCVMAVLITFFAISLSIVNIGDISAVSDVGKKLFGRIFLLLPLVTLIFILITMPFVNISRINGTHLDVKSLYDILLSFIPTNIVQPFIDFNAAQIMIIGIMFGIPMLLLGDKADNLKNVFSECNTVAIITNCFFNTNIMPVFVGLSFMILVFENKFSFSTGSLKILTIVLGAYTLLILLYSLYTKIKTGCRLSTLYRVFFPTFLANLSSANYGASFVMSYNALAETGVDPNYISVGHNFGGVLFKPGYSFVLSGTAMIMADVAGVDLSTSSIVMLFILTLILTASLPTIPGSAIAGISVIFAQLCIDSSYLATAIAAYAILDFAAVAVNGFILQCELLIGAKELNRIDKNVKKDLWV